MMDGSLGTHVSLDTFVTLKVFDLFRTRLVPIVNAYRKDDVKTELYKHIFLAPESYSKKRAFQVKGVSSPFVCLWASSPLSYSKAFYARSVMPIDFEYLEECLHCDTCTKDTRCKGLTLARGFLYDYEKTFELSSSSYFANFRGAVMQDLLDLDRVRYFDINVDELLPGYSCKIELLLENMAQSEQVDQTVDNRSFNLGAKYTLRVTLPVLSKSELYIQKVNMFIHSYSDWLRESQEVSP
jgi:hypothetical protein